MQTIDLRFWDLQSVYLMSDHSYYEVHNEVRKLARLRKHFSYAILKDEENQTFEVRCQLKTPKLVNVFDII